MTPTACVVRRSQHGEKSEVWDRAAGIAHAATRKRNEHKTPRDIMCVTCV